MKLTKREKVLLYILLCMVIFIGGAFLLVMPTMEKNNTLKNEKIAAQMDLDTTRASKIEYPNLENEIKVTSKELKEIKDKMYGSLKKEDIDALITEMAVNHALVPVSLSISEQTKEDVVNYEAYKKALETTSNSNEKEKKDTALTMKVFNINLVVKGSVANLQDLVNDANQSKSLKISSVTYTEQSEEDKSMTIAFKLFMN